MTVLLLFAFLSTLAVLGAGGVLFLRQTMHCTFSFLLCGVALAGLYLLLSNPFLAAVQLVGVFLAGAVLVSGVLAFDPDARGCHAASVTYWLAGAVFVGVTLWGIARGRIGVPILRSVPMWAVQEGHVAAFGRELLTRYLIAFELLGLLLLVSVVGVTYLARQSRPPPRPSPEIRGGREEEERHAPL